MHEPYAVSTESDPLITPATMLLHLLHSDLDKQFAMISQMMGDPTNYRVEIMDGSPMARDLLGSSTQSWSIRVPTVDNLLVDLGIDKSSLVRYLESKFGPFDLEAYVRAQMRPDGGFTEEASLIRSDVFNEMMKMAPPSRTSQHTVSRDAFVLLILSGSEGLVGETLRHFGVCEVEIRKAIRASLSQEME